MTKLYIVGILILLLSSCGDNKKNDSNQESSTTITQLNEEQVSMFAIELEKAIDNFDVEKFKEYYSDEIFIDLIIAKSNIDASYNRQVIKKELKKANLTNTIFQLMTSSADRMFKRVSLAINNNDFTLSYRISPNIGEIEYLMIIGRQDDDGNLVCYDVMSLTKGDTYSAMFAEMITTNTGLAYELPDWNENYRLMVEAQKMGNTTLALENYEKLPKNIQDLKITRIIHLKIVEEHGEEALISAALDFVDKFDDNDSLSLFNGFLMMKIGKCEEAMNYFNVADSVFLGGDSFTNVYRAHASNCLGDYEEALNHLTNVDDIELYANTESVTSARMAALIGLKEFKKASEYLPTLFQSFGMDIKNNEELVQKLYPSLYLSDEYKTWSSTQNF